MSSPEKEKEKDMCEERRGIGGEYDMRLSHVALKKAWKLMRLAVDTG